jgi:hypothetical protein
LPPSIEASGSPPDGRHDCTYTQLKIQGGRSVDARERGSKTLGGMLVHVQHSESQSSFKTVPSDAQLEEALRQLKITAAPLLAPLTAEERTAAGTEETYQP